MDEEKAPETAPKPKKPRMVKVYNAHKFRSFHLGQGRKIGPGETGTIPHKVYEKTRDQLTWLKRAERGDVI